MQNRVIAAFIFCLAGFIISLLLLTAGTKANFLESAALAIVPYYFSHQYSIYGTVPDLDPSGNTYEWFSLHFLSICFGDYTTDANGESNGVTNVSCDTSIAPGTKVFNIGRAFVPWTIGVGLAGMAFLIFPFFFRGTFHHNSWPMWFLFLSWIFLMLGAVFGSVYAGLLDYNGSRGSLFIPLTWTAVGCIFIAWVVEFVEYGLQRFTPKGQPISAKHKPANVPWVSVNKRGLARAVNHDIGMMRADLGGMAHTI